LRPAMQESGVRGRNIRKRAVVCSDVVRAVVIETALYEPASE
jgi:hypothetical protein